MKKDYKFIQIIEVEKTKSGKTPVFLVRSILYDVDLGYIKWNPGWRKYSFYPEPDTFYEEVCLSNIVEFLEELKKMRNKK